MRKIDTDNNFFGTEKISRILLKIAPPVMLAQLIQALYNIVDSFFVGRYSTDALTALTVIYPLQLIIIALAVGTGVGVNIFMARKFAQERPKEAFDAAGAGMVLAVFHWILFTAISLLIMRPYVKTSATSPEAIANAVTYGTIVCVGSLGSFLEGNWSKVHQAQGNMRTPMLAGIVCFLGFPQGIISLFSKSEEVHAIGTVAFPIIGTSFISAVFSLMMPVFFQAIGDGKTSLFLSLLRQIFCLVPIFWLFSRIGLNYTWIAFPASETIAGAVGTGLYLRVVRKWKK